MHRTLTVVAGLVAALAPACLAQTIGVQCAQRKYANVYTSDSIANVALIDGDTLYLYTPDRIRSLDISDPMHPAVLDEVPVADRPGAARLVGGRLYVGTESSLEIYDATDPASLTLLGSVPTPDDARAFSIDGTLAYIVDFSDAVDIVDVSNPASPAFVGQYVATRADRLIESKDNVAFIIDSPQQVLTAVRMGNPSPPALLYTLPAAGDVAAMAIDGYRLYVADTDADALHIYDITNPRVAIATLLGSVALPIDAYPRDIKIVGDTLYLAGNDAGVVTIDVSDPSNPAVTGEYATADADRLAALPDGHVYFFSDPQTELLALDLSEPFTSVTSIIPPPMPSGFRSVERVGDTVFATLVGDGGGLYAYDVSDPANPALLDQETSLWPLHLVANGDYLYADLASAGQLAVYDIADPSNISVVTTVPAVGANFYDLEIRGSRLYASVEYQVQSFDISNPALPVPGAAISPSGSFLHVAAFYEIAVSGSDVFLMFRNDVAPFEVGLISFDFSDPANPAQTGHLIDPLLGARDLYVDGSLAYLENETLTTLDISNPASPTIVAALADPLPLGGPDIDIRDGMLYYGLTACDLSNPLAPSYLGGYDLPTIHRSTRIGDDGHAYAAASEGGIFVVDMTDCPPPCPADLTGDGTLNLDDVDAFIAAYLGGDPAADLDANGSVNLDDLDAFIASFLAGCP